MVAAELFTTRDETMTKYGVLLVGAKRTHQQSHAAVFAAHPSCKLVAVASEKGDPEDRVEQYQELADDLGIPHIPDLDVALARDDVHIVSSTPAVERRAIVAARCMDAGKHVYLDKPLAGTVEDIDIIVSAAERNDIVTRMFTQNLSGWVQEAKQAVQNGEIGELKAIHAENLFSKGRAGSVPKGTVRKETENLDRYTYLEAKREMFDVGIYSLGFIHEITGGLKFESVLGHTGNYFFAEHNSVGVEDFGVMMATLEGGITATLLGGRFGWTSHPLSGPQKIVVIGTERTLSFDPFALRVEVYNNELDFTQPAVDPYDPMGMWAASHPAYAAMDKRRWVTFGDTGKKIVGLPNRSSGNVMADDVSAFVTAIEEDAQSEMDAKAAASLSEVILGGFVSAARGEEVKLPLPRN